MADTEYLDEERKKTWERIKVLEEALPAIRKLAEEAKSIAESKISATEEEAKKALDTALKEKDEAIQLLKEIKEIAQNYKENDTLLKNAIKTANKITEKSTQIANEEKNISENQNRIKELQIEVSAELASARTSKENISAIEAEVTSSSKKITDLQIKANERKSEIDDLYDEIMGYETHEGEHEDGLKDVLEKSYKEINEAMKKLSDDFKLFQEDKTKEVSTLTDKVRSLLPDAMSAGLAGAFYDKRMLETKAMNKAAVRFERIIMWMGIAALIPAITIICLLIQNGANWDTFKRFPGIVCAMLPIYAPLIWFGIHQNKVINLNKKLIEEYAYKEAISKTVDGLSNQIREIDDEETSKTLHERLLTLLLDTSGDNPGKYIKGYDKSDNPLAELISQPALLKKLDIEFPGLLKCLIETQEKKIEAEKAEKCQL